MTKNTVRIFLKICTFTTRIQVTLIAEDTRESQDEFISYCGRRISSFNQKFEMITCEKRYQMESDVNHLGLFKKQHATIIYRKYQYGDSHWLTNRVRLGGSGHICEWPNSCVGTSILSTLELMRQCHTMRYASLCTQSEDNVILSKLKMVAHTVRFFEDMSDVHLEQQRTIFLGNAINSLNVNGSDVYHPYVFLLNYNMKERVQDYCAKVNENMQQHARDACLVYPQACHSFTVCDVL